MRLSWLLLVRMVSLWHHGRLEKIILIVFRICKHSTVVLVQNLLFFLCINQMRLLSEIVHVLRNSSVLIDLLLLLLGLIVRI